MFLTAFLTVIAAFATWVAADPFRRSMGSRGVVIRAHEDPCKVAHKMVDAAEKCHTAHCKCLPEYFQVFRYLVICEANHLKTERKKNQLIAQGQYDLNATTSQCRDQGIEVFFQLQLSSGQATILKEMYHKDEKLRQFQAIFLALQVAGGHFGLVILLLASFARKAHRNPAFFNFCLTWIFSSIVYSILLYRGTQGNTAEYPHGGSSPGLTKLVKSTKCLAQASLINGVQVMTACSTIALVIQWWLSLRTAIYGFTRSHKKTQWITLSLVVTPYIFFVAFTLPSVLIDVQSEEHLKALIDGKFPNFLIAAPNKFYCALVMGAGPLNPFMKIIYAVTLGLLGITVFFDALIMNILLQNWWTFRRVQAKSAISLSVFLRLIVFSIYRVVVAVAFGAALVLPSLWTELEKGRARTNWNVPVWVDMLQAAIPLTAFLCLGTNQDLFTALMFWRKQRAPVSIMTSARSTDVKVTEKTWEETDLKL